MAQNIPKISLCMIVKNEEHTLESCLESVIGEVDEIVVVDTGSDDGTRRIAEAHGARVVTFSWTGDFSAARNVSLAHASGDWILWLDADERLLPGTSQGRLHALIASNVAGAFLVPIRNLKPEAGFDLHYAIRLFRKVPNACFEGKVHEGVDTSLTRAGVQLETAPFLIEHHGYAVSAEVIEAKLRRNLKLLEEQARREPGSCFTHYYLGLTHIGLKNHAASFQHLRKAYQLPAPTPNIRCLIANLLAYHAIAREDFTLAEKFARSSLQTVAQQNTAKLFLGIALYNQNRFSDALPLLLQAYQFSRLPIENRCTRISQEHSCDEADLLKALARCYDRTGDYAGAHGFLRRYLVLHGNDAAAWAGLGRCAILLGNVAAAREALERAKHFGLTDGAETGLLMEAYLQLDDRDRAGDVLAECPGSFFQDECCLNVFQQFVERSIRTKQVEKLYHELSRLSRRFPYELHLLDALAVCCIKTSRFDRAASALEQLRCLDPTNAGVMRRLAAVYLESGDPSRAERLLLTGGSPGSRGTGDAFRTAAEVPGWDRVQEGGRR